MTIEFLTEDKQGKNLHLEHLEDEILNFGVNGGRASIEFLRSLRDMLSGASRSSVNMTVKWDGAPAVFAGIDPADNKFFVAKKSVFNVTPKLYKTNADVDADTSGDLNTKLKVALKEFSKLGIKGVLQGDLMFTQDSVENDTIDGVKYYTFQPNTIVYAVPVDSDLGKIIKSANIGVVWHTTYSGKELQDMKASFGVNISSLTKSSKVTPHTTTNIPSKNIEIESNSDFKIPGKLILSDNHILSVDDSQRLVGLTDLKKYTKKDQNLISRSHFTVYKKDQKYFIQDGGTNVQNMPSENHTMVNEEKLSENEQMKMKN